MKVLSIGLDQKVLDPQSAVAERLRVYGSMVDRLTVVVPSGSYGRVAFSPKIEVYGSGGFGRLQQFIKLLMIVHRQLASDKFSLITVQDIYFLGLLGLVMGRWHGLPVEIQVHGFEKESFWRRWLSCLVLRQANGIRVVSQRLRQDIQQRFSVPADCIYIVPIHSNLFGIRPERHLPLAQNKIILFTVGRVVPVKNIGLQIELLAALKAMNLSIELWIAGEGPELEALREQARTLGVSQLICWLGWRDDLEPFYRQADIFLLTSNSEGWGMAVVEAAAWGLPIVMTDVVLAGEVIINEQSGLVIPIGGREALIAAVQRLLTNRDLRIKVGQVAAATVRNLPNLETTARLIIGHWQQLAGQSKMQ